MKEQFLRRYGLALLWLISIPIYIFGGFHVLYYPQIWIGRVMTISSFPYLEVFANIVFSGIVVVILYFMIRFKAGRYSAIRWLTALIILGIASCFMVVGVSDAGYFQDLRALWLAMVIVSLVVAFSVITYRRLVEHSSRRLEIDG